MGKISENLHKISENLSKTLKIWAKMAPKITSRAFLEITSSYGVFFSGKFARIRAKILRTPKNWPAPTPLAAN